MNADTPNFPATVGNDEQAAIFVGHWLAPIFDAPYAVDSRLTDGVWVHQIHTDQPDTAAARARQTAAWLRRLEDEDADQ